MDVTARFLGVWSLVSWTAISGDGKLIYPYGKDAVGRIMYHAGGTMAAHLMRRRRTLFASDNPKETTAAEHKAAFREYFSYFGSFTVQVEAGTVTHHAAGASNPNWVGSDQVRSFQFSDKTLTLSLVHQEGARHELVWERIGG